MNLFSVHVYIYMHEFYMPHIDAGAQARRECWILYISEL